MQKMKSEEFYMTEESTFFNPFVYICTRLIAPIDLPESFHQIALIFENFGDFSPSV
jgi:hypothetical protein